MAYLQLAHFKGALSLGRPYRSHEGFEHVTNVLLTGSGSPDMLVGLRQLLLACALATYGRLCHQNLL
jgi:hypothetical protein